jgi:hypothetical protein
VSFQESLTVLSALARRLRRDPRYMAYVLAAYQDQEGLTDEELTHELGTLPELAVRLALCKRPSSSSPNFTEQVRDLADYTLTDAARLTSILRQVDALEGLSEWVAVSTAPQDEEGESDHVLSGLLAAARDRVEPADTDTRPTDEDTESED